jgi:hypothetical protein
LLLSPQKQIAGNAIKELSEGKTDEIKRKQRILCTLLILIMRAVLHAIKQRQRTCHTGVFILTFLNLFHATVACNPWLMYCLSLSVMNTQFEKNVGLYTKAVPLQAWGGPEGSRKLRFPDFLTTVHDGGKVVSHTHRPHLPPGNSPGTHFC